MIAPSRGRRKTRGARVAGLRPRRHRADLDEAEAEGEQRVGHLAVLVEAGGDADRIGEVEAEETAPRRGSARPAPRMEAALRARDAPAGAPSPDRARRGAAAAARTAGSWQAIREAMAAVGRERQRLDPEHGGEVERSVEMREEVAAARRLVAERRPEPRRVDRDEDQVACAGKMPRRGLARPARRSRNG